MAQATYPEQIRALKPTDIDSTIGSGFQWPPAITSEGTLAISSGKDHVEDCVLRLVHYNKGYLVGAYSFGGNVLQRVFGVLATNTVGLTKDDIETAIANWEDRVDTVRVTVAKSMDSQVAMEIIIQYQLSLTGSDESMTFPIPKG